MIPETEQQAYIGASAIDHFRTIVSERNPRHIFLVRGRNAYVASGAKDLIDAVVSQVGCRVTEFMDFATNPQFADVSKGLQLLPDDTDLLIAVGGGSVLDMAKLIRFFRAYTGDLTGTDFVRNSEPIPLYALPTTAGTGCEATQFAVVYRDKTKYSVAHPAVLPDIAFVYPPFTYDTSAYLTATAGFDALSQAIEAYWNVYATDESDSYAMRAIGLLWHHLPVAVHQATDEVRDRVMEGAYWAGRAINITRTTAPHAMSYAFTSWYGFPHGHAVALTFPFFAACNMRMPEADYNGTIPFEAYQAKMQQLENALDMCAGENIADRLIAYIRSLGLSFDLPAGLDKKLIVSQVNAQRAGNNPRKITRTLLESIVDSLVAVSNDKG